MIGGHVLLNTVIRAHTPREANNESSEVIDILLPVTIDFNPSTRLDCVAKFPFAKIISPFLCPNTMYRELNRPVLFI